ncbi:type II secretion system F family protein [Streptacidiphilus sp. N1-10]|uniref:Type II secretion system F family protein n=1 Tax=Streptacidiphilus jeojiensis TaxID=3229225 RepID=A0ABV6XXE7_9ACTN
MSGLGYGLEYGSGATAEWTGAAAAVLGLPAPVLRATAAGALLCLLGWGAWRLAERDVTRRRQGWLFPRSQQSPRPERGLVHRLGMKPRGGTRPPPELLLLPLGLLAAWPTHSPLVAVVAAGAVVPAIRLRRRRRGARLEESRRRAVVGLCAALAGELRTGATPNQAVETAVSDGTVPEAQALDCTVLLAAVRYGGSVPEAFQALAELPGAEGAAGIAACWQVSSSSGAGLADGLDRVAEGLRAERSLAESIRAELAGPRSTAGLLAALPLFGLLLGIALGADPLRMLLHTPGGLVCLFGGALLEWAGLAWTARIAGGAEAVPA